mgnify:FL=1
MIDKKLREIKFPAYVLVISIERDNMEFIPSADDKILLGNKITVLVNARDSFQIDAYLNHQ